LRQLLQQFIHDQRLLQPGQALLVAVSGGLDSMVLATLLHELGYHLTLAHANFQLRAEAADADADAVARWALDRGIDCRIKKFDTKTRAVAEGWSVQMTARKLRYAWFNTLCEELQLPNIATAHHRDDHIETFFLNFLRGTGIDGMCGIPVRAGNLVRPLRFASRRQILDFALAEGITWREDASNATDEYTRNYLRNQILPQFRHIQPDWERVAERNIAYLEGSRDNLRFLSAAYRGSECNALEKARLHDLPDPIGFIFEWLKPFGFDAEQAAQIVSGINITGRFWESKSGYRVFSDRKLLLLDNPGPDLPPPIFIEADDRLVTLHDGQRLLLLRLPYSGEIPKDPEVVAVDAENLKFPLRWRRWEAGDLFQPLGMNGKHQKIHDLLTNLKISRRDKENVYVLENGNQQIIWVAGYRTDHRFRVTPSTREIIKMTRVYPD
jgi:tRNA(Ile)-lysidine synthase